MFSKLRSRATSRSASSSASLALLIAAAVFALDHVQCAAIVGADFDVKAKGPDGGSSTSPPLEGCTDSRMDCNGLASDGCEIETANDPDHCGGCDTRCPSPQLCAGATCVESCPGSTIACGRSCVNLATSKAHCGRCNNVCQETSTCTGGSCEQCGGTPCKLTLPQCGCDDGKGCYVDTNTKPSCQKAGTMSEGSVCAVDTDCQPGHLCENIAQTVVAVCKRVCEQNADCSSVGSYCRPSAHPTLKVCTIGCDPVTNAKCPMGTGCGLVQDPAPGKERWVDCVKSGTAQQNAPCTSATLCAGGYNCAEDPPSSGTYICAHYCRSGLGPNDCPSNTSCMIADFTNKIGSTVYGACFP